VRKEDGPLRIGLVKVADPVEDLTSRSHSRLEGDRVLASERIFGAVQNCLDKMTPVKIYEHCRNQSDGPSTMAQDKLDKAKLTGCSSRRLVPCSLQTPQAVRWCARGTSADCSNLHVQCYRLAVRWWRHSLNMEHDLHGDVTCV
jgi:hypothetical protein